MEKSVNNIGAGVEREQSSITYSDVIYMPTFV